MLNFGVIGLGRIGRIHTENIVREFKNVRIKTLTDIYLNDDMILWAKKLGIENWTKCYQDLLIDDDIHAILICSPSDTHCDVIIDCIRSNKHIFCEKPLGINIEEVRKVICEYEKNIERKQKIQIGFNRRFDHNFQAIKQAIASKQIGQPHILKLTSRDPNPPSFHYLKLSAGLFQDMTIHDFDMARYLLNDDIIEVYASGAILFDSRLHELNDIDTAVIVMKTKSGTLVTIDNSRQAIYGYDQRTEVFGSKGQATIANDTSSSIIISNNDGIHSEKPLQFFLERYKQSYINEIREFIDAIINDKAVPVTIYDSLEVAQIAKAAELSLTKNRPVSLAEVSEYEEKKINNGTFHSNTDEKLSNGIHT